MDYEETTEDLVKYIANKFAENPGHFAAIILQMYWGTEKQLNQYKVECERLKRENNNLKQSVNEYKDYAESHVANYLEFRTLEKENEKLKQEIRQLKGEG